MHSELRRELVRQREAELAHAAARELLIGRRSVSRRSALTGLLSAVRIRRSRRERSVDAPAEALP